MSAKLASTIVLVSYTLNGDRRTQRVSLTPDEVKEGPAAVHRILAATHKVTPDLISILDGKHVSGPALPGQPGPSNGQESLIPPTPPVVPIAPPNETSAGGSPQGTGDGQPPASGSAAPPAQPAASSAGTDGAAQSNTSRQASKPQGGRNAH